MTALVQGFVDIVTILFGFVKTQLVPADFASTTILHVAIWLPVVIGLISLTVGMTKSLWSRGGKKA